MTGYLSRLLNLQWFPEFSVRYIDLTKGKPDLRSSKIFLRGNCQKSGSLEIPTSIVVSKRKES